MEVIGKCNLKNFIQITKDNWLKCHHEDECFDNIQKKKFICEA